MAENQEKQSSKERLKEITDSIEVGIQNLFESEKYTQYLRTMSRFPRYSLNNTMLIAMQKPDATLVAGFNKWKDSFSRYVKKGEKGIKIIAPTPYKIKEEREKVDPITQAPVLDANGKVEIEEVERQIPMFRVVSIFDISQTEGEPLPSLVNDLTGDVAQFSLFMEAIKRTSPVPIAMEQMPSDKDGYYDLKNERIAIREGMSEVQTISAAIHEMAHSMLHSRKKVKEMKDSNLPKKDRNTEEVEAESISFAVCNYYGIETSDNSFGYIANWSKGKELKELKSSLETINKTSSQIITGIDTHFGALVKEHLKASKLMKEIYQYEMYHFPRELAYQINDGYLAIHDCDEGFDYSFYDKDYNLIDGGVYDDIEINIYEAIHEVAEFDNGFSIWNRENVKQVKGENKFSPPTFVISPLQASEITALNYEELVEKVENMELSKVVGSVKYSDVTNEFVIASPLFKDVDLPLYTNHEGEQFVFGYGELGGGTNVWNYLDETDHDYTNVAHISEAGHVTLLVDNLPETAKSALEEKEFVERKDESFAIYQIKSGIELKDYRFTGIKELENMGKEIHRENYNLVYTDGLQNVEGVSHALDCLYYDFNQDKPGDFIGHSLSVSDIVAINMNGAVSYYYVDTVGFKELEHFVQPNPDNYITGEKISTRRGNFSLTSLSKEEMKAQGYGVHHNSDDGRYAIMGNGTIAYAVQNENTLKAVEMATEQNCNMIDGIINNQPTVDELEQDAKNGKPVSLMELLDATRREQKKQSPKTKKEKQTHKKGVKEER
ncbi:MAG: YodL domain-containing protein [Eubacteriales bacterium]